MLKSRQKETFINIWEDKNKEIIIEVIKNNDIDIFIERINRYYIYFEGITSVCSVLWFSWK